MAQRATEGKVMKTRPVRAACSSFLRRVFKRAERMAPFFS
jgi:hypothetical protein